MDRALSVGRGRRWGRQRKKDKGEEEITALRRLALR